MLLDKYLHDLQKFTRKKVSYEAVASVLGLGSKQAVSNRITRKTELKDWEIEALDYAFKNNTNQSTQLLETPEDSILGDYYPEVFASCGNGCYTLSETKEPILIPKKCFKKPFSNVKKYSVIVARGDSMEPTIYDKDRLIVEHYETGEQIKDNSIYVFGYYNEIYVKRLIKNIDEIIIKSDNIDPIYKTKFIQKEEMNNVVVIGEIVGLIRDFR